MGLSGLKSGKTLSVPLSLAGGQRDEGPALHQFPGCCLPQLSVRLSPARSLAAACHPAGFLLPRFACSLQGGGGEGADWGGLRWETPPVQVCSLQLEGRPRVWRPPGPFGETELPFRCQSSVGLGWGPEAHHSWASALHVAWCSAEAGWQQMAPGRSQEAQTLC